MSPGSWDTRLLVPVLVAVACLVAGLALLGDAALSVFRGPSAPAAAPARPAAPSPAPSLPLPTTTATPSALTALGTPSVPAPTGPSAGAPPGSPAVPSGPLPLAGRTVVVDPGHNRDDTRSPGPLERQVDVGGTQGDCDTPGSRSADGYAESTFTWRTASALRRRLVALGAEVVLTRPADAGVGPCVDARGQVAARTGADLLVSLHADAGPEDGVGFSVASPGLVPRYTEQTVAPSARLALAVRDAMRATGLRPSSYAGKEGLEVRTDLGTLNRSPAPAVEVDCGTLRNPAEARRLSSGGGQEQCAAGVAAGIAAFLRP